MTMIPEAAFIRLAGPNSDGSIKHTISIVQNQNRTLMEEWTGIYPIERVVWTIPMNHSEETSKADDWLSLQIKG
jgi:hypothetical protein